jgi:hypothetical protein
MSCGRGLSISGGSRQKVAKSLKATKVGHDWLIDPKDLDAVTDRKVGRPRKVRKTSKS